MGSNRILNACFKTGTRDLLYNPSHSCSHPTPCQTSNFIHPWRLLSLLHHQHAPWIQGDTTWFQKYHLRKRRDLTSKCRKPNNWISNVCTCFSEIYTENMGTAKDSWDHGMLDLRPWVCLNQISNNKDCSPLQIDPERLELSYQSSTEWKAAWHPQLLTQVQHS